MVDDPETPTPGMPDSQGNEPHGENNERELIDETNGESENQRNEQISSARQLNDSDVSNVLKNFSDAREKIMSAFYDRNIRARLSESDIDILNYFLLGQVPVVQAAEALNKIGVKNEDAQKFLHLYPAFREIIKSNTDLSRHISNSFLSEKMREAQEELSVENVVKTFFSKNGTDVFPKEQREAFKKLVTKYFYHLFRDIDQNPNKLFNDLYNPYIHGYYLSGLQGLLSEIINNPQVKDLLSKDTKNDAYKFLRGMSGYSQSLFNYGQLFHDLPIYALDPSTQEKWASFLSTLYPSELAVFLDDPVVKIARNEVGRYIRMRIALNGNQIPTDLFGGRYHEGKIIYEFEDRDKLRKIITNRVSQLNGDGSDLEVEEWEIDRAISYSIGIGLMNLQDIETMGTADSRGDFKSIPDVIKFLKKRHDWKSGRGGFAITHAPEIFTMDIVHNPERRSFMKRLFKKRKWIPKSIHDFADEKVRELGSELDYKLLDREGAYQELMNIFDIGSQLSRAGWRHDHLMPNENTQTGRRLKKLIEDNGLKWSDRDKLWGNEEWNNFMEIVSKEFGTGALWWYIGERVESELKRALSIKLGILNYDGVGHVVHSHELHQYKLGDKAYEKIIEVDDELNPGKKKKVTLYDFQIIKENQIKGEIFRFFLKRSTGDFLLNLTQLTPELLDSKSEIWLTDDEIKVKHGTDKLKAKQSITNKHFLLEKWGNNGYEKLKKIRDWYKKLVETLESDERFGADIYPNEKDRRNAVLSYFFEETGTALERVKQKSTLSLEEQDFDNKVIFSFIDDLQKTIGLNEDFGEFDTNGEYGFIYKMARAWSIKQGNTNPNNSDIEYFKIYQDISEAGQGMIRRLHNDVHHWNEATSKLANLDEMLEHIASSGNFKEIYELHHEIHKLEGIVGIDEIRKANYILASIVASYFWEHSTSRLPGGVLLNAPVKLALGRNISLSKIHGGITAYSMNEQDIRDYFYRISLVDNFIAEKGKWSYEQAKLAFDASTDTYITGKVLPSILTILSAYIMYMALKKALEDENKK